MALHLHKQLARLHSPESINDSQTAELDATTLANDVKENAHGNNFNTGDFTQRLGFRKDCSSVCTETLQDTATRVPLKFSDNTHDNSVTTRKVKSISKVEKETCESSKLVMFPTAAMEIGKLQSEKKAVSSIPIDPLKTLSFPAKLHAILSQKIFKDIISWMPHGRSWRIHKPKAFELNVIPHFFVHCKYSSFIRQANGWGFRRMTQGPDQNSYYHKYFLRGRPKLCYNMVRPGTFKKSASDPDNEPNFYHMSGIDPLPEVEDIIQPKDTIADAFESQKNMTDKSIVHIPVPSTDCLNKIAQEVNELELYTSRQQKEYMASLQDRFSLEQTSRQQLNDLEKRGEKHEQSATLMHEVSSTSFDTGDFSRSQLFYQSDYRKSACIPDNETANFNDSTPTFLEELIEISQYFRSRRGENESADVRDES